MGLALRHVTFDCSDPQALAGFWAHVTGGTVEDDWGEFVTLRTPGLGVGHLAFGHVADPSPGTNKVHLDLATADRPAEVARLVELGATVVAEHQVPGLEWTVLADPEGNHFCVAQHD